MEQQEVNGGIHKKMHRLEFNGRSLIAVPMSRNLFCSVCKKRLFFHLAVSGSGPDGGMRQQYHQEPVTS